jgi:hypothetical protein
MKKLNAAVLALGLVLAAAPASATATFEYIFDGGYPLAVSNDGTVVAGNLANGGYGAFRWTQATGLVPLGRVAIYGVGGSPGMSSDGSRIASTIGSADSSYTTQGLWTLGSGWQELMPPVPADGGTMDGSYGSIWGLSGDGTTAVGLYWRPGQGNGAHASKWTQATGVVDLGGTTTDQGSRANCVNFDGSVSAGWVEAPTGLWRPAAWDHGVFVLLTNYSGVTNEGMGEARCMNRPGDIIAGFAQDVVSNQRAAALWKRTGGVWGPTQFLGWIDGSEPGYGKTIPYAVTDDGHLVIGYASYAGDPFDVTGFVWTQETGVVDAPTWLATNGVFVDPNFTIQALTAMTPDGTKIFGYGQMLVSPFTRKAFRITVASPVGVQPQGPSTGMALSAPSPNPSSSATRLEFELAQSSNADLTIFDAAGRRIATLLSGEQPAGRRTVTWNGQDEGGQTVAAGIYFARLSTPRGATSRRLVRVN